MEGGEELFWHEVSDTAGQFGRGVFAAGGRWNAPRVEVGMVTSSGKIGLARKSL